MMSRLDGIDLARALAVLGMFVAHTFAHSHPDTAWLQIFDGRASVLFALLAGMSIEFLTRKRRPLTDLSLIIRGVILFVLGLTLSALPVGPMVILTTYGALYMLVAPLAYRLSTKWLAIGAVITAIGFPTFNWLIRDHLPPVPEFGWTPTWQMLLNGDYRLFAEILFFNGLFPVITWIPFFLLGIVVARLLVSSTRRMPVALLIGGTIFGVAGLALSKYVLDVRGFRQWYAGFHPDGWLATNYLLNNAFGTPVPDDPRWLFVYVPHSGSFAELISSSGFAVAAVGLCLLLIRPLGRLLTPITRLGRMPLTVYSAHIVALGAAAHYGFDLTTSMGAWANLIVPILFAWAWLARFKRGPLEAVLSTIAQAPAKLTRR